MGRERKRREISVRSEWVLYSVKEEEDKREVGQLLCPRQVLLIVGPSLGLALVMDEVQQKATLLHHL